MQKPGSNFPCNLSKIIYRFRHIEILFIPLTCGKFMSMTQILSASLGAVCFVSRGKFTGTPQGLPFLVHKMWVIQARLSLRVTSLAL